MSGNRLPRGGTTDKKAKNFGATLKKLAAYLAVYKARFALVLLFAVASSVFAVLGPKILGGVTTEIFNGVGTSQGVDFGKIAGILLWLVALYLVSAGFSYIQSFIMTGIANKVTFSLRKELNEKISKLPFSYYDGASVGDVLSRVTNDVDSINQSLNQSLTQSITSTTTMIGVLAMMFSISFYMAVIAIITLPVSFVCIGVIVKISQKHFRNQQKYLGAVNGIVEENYSCHNIIKAFNGEERARERFGEGNDELYNATWKANFLSGLMMPVMNVVSNIGYVVVCVVGGYFAVRGRLSVGDIQAFIQYMRQISQPISQMSQISSVLQQTTAAAERVFAFLEEQEENDDNMPLSAPIRGSVTFKNVSFGYVPGKTIINNFSATVSPGQKIAIVGPTGAGKTTLIKLLMRFYELNGGEILLDGHDIKAFPRDELRSAFGMVLQETWLFNGTIEENIRYGKLSAADETVRDAASVAQADRFILTLPEGYQMTLNEEADNISQGQKQLLTIARAVLADPKILILDEATSSVDTRTETLIQRAMDNLMVGRTSFIIAHRLSTIRNADLIFVMKDGDVIEQGSHDKLIADGGFYANMYNSQFSKVA